MMTGVQEKLFTRKKIMIAATGKLFRDLLVVTAKESGAAAILEGTGIEMLRQAEHFAADLIFCEYEMVDLDGLGFLRELRRDLKLKTPVVMMVSQFDGEAQARARAAGANEIMAIPFSVQDILSASKKLLAQTADGGHPKLRFGPRNS